VLMLGPSLNHIGKINLDLFLVYRILPTPTSLFLVLNNRVF
jgi:hypothetical protein